MYGLIEIGDKVVLYGFFDGFAHKTDGTTNGLVTLKTGERVEIPLEGIMKKRSDYHEKGYHFTNEAIIP